MRIILQSANKLEFFVHIYYRNDAKASMLTNQIWKIHNSLYQYCIPGHCKSAFKSIGIDYKLFFENGKKKEVATFKIEDCAKIRCYYIDYILELIKNNKELTPNQNEILLIYQQQQQNQIPEVRKRFRLTILLKLNKIKLYKTIIYLEIFIFVIIKFEYNSFFIRSDFHLDD